MHSAYEFACICAYLFLTRTLFTRNRRHGRERVVRGFPAPTPHPPLRINSTLFLHQRDCCARFKLIIHRLDKRVQKLH